MMGSRDNMQRVEGDVGGGKQGCRGGDCSLCTASEFMLKCWECACEGGKFKYKNNGFHRCRTESGHTDVDWRQDSRVGHLEIEEVETLCAKCCSGYEEDMLLCDGYVPPRIVPQKKEILSVLPSPNTILSLLTRQETHRCEAGWHMQCLDPPLSNVPDEDWVFFCTLMILGVWMCACVDVCV